MLRSLRQWMKRFTHEAISLRRFEAAKTTRLNKTHWEDARGETVNQDLELDGATLTERCEFEARNNPYVDGVISTHATDLAGSDGPSFQHQSENEDYNASLEQIWREFFADPDLAGQTSGVEILHQWVHLLWKRGEFLTQLVRDRRRRRSGPITLRLNQVHPRRLETPPAQGGNQAVALGVERDRFGRPIAYHVQQATYGESTAVDALRYRRIPASDVIHGFRRQEPGQVRGVPWLASVLQVVADLRDYDAYVLEAAKMAALYGVVWYTDHPDSPFLEVNETADIARGQQTTGPPGWRPFQLEPRQPNTQYKSYRLERLRDLGRPVGMPLLTVALDSSGHNFSSARFDGQVYQRSNAALQGWLERTALNRLVRLVEREAQLAGALPRQTPAGRRLTWTWPTPPHVDPSRESRAEGERIRHGSLTLHKAAAAHGLDFETLFEELMREVDRFRRNGLVHPFEAAQGAGGGSGDGAPESEDAVREIVDEVLAERTELVTGNGRHR